MYVKHISILHLFLLNPKIAHRFVQDEIINKINSPIDQTELILNCWSEHIINRFELLFDNIIKYNFKRITVLVDINSKKNFQSLPNYIVSQIELVVIDSIHILSARVVWGGQSLLSWNKLSSVGFFPTGLLTRFNRILLLEKLYNANTLENIIWTLPKSKEQYSNVIDYYKTNYQTVPSNFDEFYSYCSANAVTVDRGISPLAFTDFARYFLVSSHPTEIYNDVGFIIVAETWSPDHLGTMITEKIPLAIMNHRPFILAGSPGTLKRLQDQGFNTFNKYLPFPEYDSVKDNDIRLDQIVENIKAFPNILSDHCEEIEKDIMHNVIRLNQIADQTADQLVKFASDRGLSYTSLNEEFGLDPWVHQHYVHFTGYPNYSKPNGIELKNKEKQYLKELVNSDPELVTHNHQLWLAHYNAIKGVNWPNILTHDDFNNLPSEIKNECTSKFNFNTENIYL